MGKVEKNVLFKWINAWSDIWFDKTKDTFFRHSSLKQKKIMLIWEYDVILMKTSIIFYLSSPVIEFVKVAFHCASFIYKKKKNLSSDYTKVGSWNCQICWFFCKTESAASFSICCVLVWWLPSLKGKSFCFKKNIKWPMI